MKGFSLRNINYMRQFASVYPDFTIMQQHAAQLPWGHHMLLIDKVKDVNNRIFYMQKAIENGWSRNFLSLQIKSSLHNRQGAAITNFTATLPAIQSDLATQVFKYPISLLFLQWPMITGKKILKKA